MLTFREDGCQQSRHPTSKMQRCCSRKGRESHSGRAHLPWRPTSGEVGVSPPGGDPAEAPAHTARAPPLCQLRRHTCAFQETCRAMQLRKHIRKEETVGHQTGASGPDLALQPGSIPEEVTPVQCPEHGAEPKWPGKKIPGRGTSRCECRKVTTPLGSCKLCTGCPISGLSFSFVKRRLCPSKAEMLEGSLGGF